MKKEERAFYGFHFIIFASKIFAVLALTQKYNKVKWID